MQFTIASAVTLALVGLAAAQPSFTNVEEDFVGVAAGEPFEITWEGAQGAATVTLVTGPSDDLEDVEVVCTSSTGSCTWTPADLPSGTYALKIEDESGSGPNYSVQFPVSGDATVTTSGDTTTESTVTESATSSETDATTTETESTTESETATTESALTEETTMTSATNSTMTTSATSTTARSPTPTVDDAEETEVPDITDSAAGHIASPLALFLVSMAALIFFN